jgi:hypothetical protein
LLPGLSLVSSAKKVDNKSVWLYNTCIEVNKEVNQMAYMSQDRKAEIAPVLKAICKKYGVKASVAVRNHMTLVLNIKSGSIDFIGNLNKVCSVAPDAGRYGEYRPAKDSVQINPYHYQNHFDGEALAFLSEVLPAMNVGNHDNSDIQTDYFDIGWYIDVNIGAWNKPYLLTK